MKPIYVLVALALLTAASAARAQTPPHTAYDPETAPSCECPFAKALQDAYAACQKMKAACGTSNPGCCTGAGCVKSCETAQAPKSCCCAKECGCCETCKAAKAQAQNQPTPLPCPEAPPVLGLPPLPMLPLPPLGVWKFQAGPAVVQLVAQPMPAPACPYQRALPVARPAKLVTPDFEAHCDQMIHRGDSIVLVGNVLLLCKKHAQPLRIEGERIVLNLNDGSFVVETSPALPRPPMPAVGTLRIEPQPAAQVRRAVAVRTEPMPERIETVIRLRHAQAVDLVNAIQTYVNGIYETYGSGTCSLERRPVIVAEPITNSVLIAAQPQEMEKITKIVGQLDQAQRPPQCPAALTPTSGVIEVVPIAPTPVNQRPR